MLELNTIIDDLINIDKVMMDNIKKRIGNITIIMSTDDEASQRYVRNKSKKCLENNINVKIINVFNQDSLVEEISKLNDDPKVDNIIVQYPIPEGKLTPQEVFNLIKPEKDIDKLNNCWFYSKNIDDLPITSYGILRIIKKIPENMDKKILFIGNGLTTNRKLFTYMFDKGYNCRITNSKTPEKDLKELIEWADIVIPATGKAEWLEMENKIVICPTIIKTDSGITSELKKYFRDKNITHNILGKIGVLTTNRVVLSAKRILK